MNKFEKLKNAVNKGITTVNVKTSSSVEKIKIKTNINSINQEIDNLKSSIGNDTYNMWIKDEFILSDLENKLNLIKSKIEEVGKLTEEMAGIDERDKEIFAGVQNAPTQDDEMIEVYKCKCPSCGERYTEVAKFCRKCGAQIQPDEMNI